MSCIISLAALIFYYHRGAILLYGDAVAHINIARRVLDSRTSGLFQLGTVWLPLPHVLNIPFIANDWLWRTGLGGSIPSTLAYVLATLGVFRLVRGLASRVAAWIAALIFALNPNLLYLQSTAMTEALYLALFVWTVIFFTDFARTAGCEPDRAAKSLRRCVLTLAAAMLVRYDAWFLAAMVGIGTVFVVARRPAPQIRRAGLDFVLLIAATAGLWLAYNHAHWGNVLEFANGPYSAHAIQLQTRPPTMPSYPGENSPRTAALYFLKVTRLNLGPGPAEYLLLTIAVVALLCAIYFSRRFLPWALLWTPAPFYVLCIAWGSVPIYFPDWWPYSYYNVRYGLQLLPAVAVFVALAYEYLQTVLKGHTSQPGREDVPHDRGFSARVRTTSLDTGSAPLGAAENSPARPEALGAEGKCRVSLAQKIQSRFSGTPERSGVVSQTERKDRGFSPWAVFAVLIVVATSYVALWRQTPICLREAQANGRARLEFDQRLAVELKKLPAASTLLMNCSAHPGAVQAAGIPFRRVLRESNPPYWEAALAEPSLAADYIVAIAGDEVDRAVRRSPQRLRKVVTVGTPTAPQATIYQSLHD